MQAKPAVTNVAPKLSLIWAKEALSMNDSVTRVPVESTMHHISPGLVTCVILYLDTGSVFAAVATLRVSSEAKFEEVVLYFVC